MNKCVHVDDPFSTLGQSVEFSAYCAIVQVSLRNTGGRVSRHEPPERWCRMLEGRSFPRYRGEGQAMIIIRRSPLLSSV